MGMDKGLVGIDRQHPSPAGMGVQHAVDPIHPETRPPIACARGPDRHVGLGHQRLGRAVVRGVVDDEEVPDPDPAVMSEEMGQAPDLVADRGTKQHRARRDRPCPVRERPQRPIGPARARQEPLAPQAQAQSGEKRRDE